ncbi:MAG TPA: ABC transporter permease [Candidatus Limnocylindrales bacterium]|nr:ABC transporter permease [Candidatus Limnocylindrales bacterium]
MKLRWFHRKREFESEMSDELRFHIEQQVALHTAAGMKPGEARRRAMLEFGAVEGVKENCRQERRGFWLETLWSNIRFALRMMQRDPGFTLVVVLTLALGIGANSAVFSAIDAILLRPLPFPDGDELMQISQYNPKIKSPQSFVAPIRLEEWNRMNSTFQAITGYYLEDASEISGTLPEKLTNALVAPRFLQVWGVAPALGRDFTPEEEHFGGPDAAIISDRFWHQRFHSDPNALGKKLRFGKWSYSIVGIMPASFDFPVRDVDFWSVSTPDAPFAQSRDSTWFTVIGRLKRGVTLAQSRANLATVQAQLGRQYPKPDADLAVDVQPLKETTVGGVRGSLWILFGSVSLLLLIACTNIVALLLARASQRELEISVRFSLGASRPAIMGQLLTEVFVLAVTGAVLGLVIAGAASRVFRTLAANLPRVDEIHLDARIVLYSLACSVAATLVCGLIPAVRGARRSISGSLSHSSVAQVSARNPIQWLLVGVQVALAVTLLAGAGLLFRSFQELGHVSPGFDTTHVLTFHVSGSWGETADMKGLTQRIDRTLDSLRNVPGVEGTATTAVLPGVPGENQGEVKIEEGQADPNRKIVAENRYVSPSYFAAMQIPILAGETCRERPDGYDVLANRSFANAYLGDSPAAGHHVEVLGQTFTPKGEIRGIVGDARELGLNREPSPTLYWCVSAPDPDPYYLVRTHGAPTLLADTIREEMHRIEPARSVFDITPLEEHLDDAFSENRLRMVLLGFFAATAVSLACVGLYGTLSYSVTVRKREVGLRLALGAMRGQIVKQFLWQGLGVTLLGCIAGGILAAAFAQVLSGMLFGVSPRDPATLSGVIAIVLAVAAVACLVPAIRAARVEPMQVLRNE